MSSGDSRSELEARVKQLNRRLGREASFFDQAVADRLGLALADVACLDLIADTGPVTAGRLSELSGLTSGATTRMIDRLEQAGYVRRVADPGDRRRVLVEGVPERLQSVGALHRSINEAQSREIAAFNDGELDLVARFLDRGLALLADETRKLREHEGTSAQEGGSFAAPLGALTKARLVFLSGAPDVTLRSDSSLLELYRAHFDGPVPRVRVRGNVVTVAYQRFGWLDWRATVGGQTLDASVHWRKDRGEIGLNSKVRWAIECRGGISRLHADLRGLECDGIELRGGGSKIELELAAPTGIVPIHITGGLNQLTVRRPVGCAIGFTLRGGATRVSLDGEERRSTGQLSMQSPGADTARDRYELEVAGGANKVAVNTY